MSGTEFPVKDSVEALLSDLRAMPAKDVEQVVELSGLARSLVWKFRSEGHAIRVITALRIEEGMNLVRANKPAPAPAEDPTRVEVLA